MFRVQVSGMPGMLSGDDRGPRIGTGSSTRLKTGSEAYAGHGDSRSLFHRISTRPGPTPTKKQTKKQEKKKQKAMSLVAIDEKTRTMAACSLARRALRRARAASDIVPVGSFNESVRATAAAVTTQIQSHKTRDINPVGS
jgi:hypothetical protein